MKISLTKILLFFGSFVIIGLVSNYFWIDLISIISAIVLIVLMHLDNLDFCKKLDHSINNKI